MRVCLTSLDINSKYPSYHMNKVGQYTQYKLCSKCLLVYQQSKEGFKLCNGSVGSTSYLKDRLYCDWCIDPGAKGHHIPRWCQDAPYWAARQGLCNQRLVGGHEISPNCSFTFYSSREILIYIALHRNVANVSCILYSTGSSTGSGRPQDPLNYVILTKNRSSWKIHVFIGHVFRGERNLWLEF